MKQDAKKNRGKFVLTIVCLILILLSMGFGIYAVVSGKTDIQGTITYYASSVAAGIYGHVEGYEMADNEDPIKDFNVSFSPSAPQGTLYNWNLGNIMFSDDLEDWQPRLNALGKDNLEQPKQPTLTIRIAIFNFAIFDEHNLSGGNIFIGNFNAPAKHENLEYSYRMGYGTIEDPSHDWRTPLDTLADSGTFTVQDREYFFVEDVYLNNADNGMYLKARNSAEDKMNVYLLDFKIRVQDPSVAINEFLTNLTINLSSTKLVQH